MYQNGSMGTDAVVSTLAELPCLTPSSNIPALLGALEQCKAELLAKLLSTAAVGSQANHNGGLLSMPQAAQRLNVPKGRVYELARQGQLPTVRIGKYVRVDGQALDLWIRQQKT